MKYDYIIVGSGIAGLYSAYQLKKRGHSVLVLEKNTDPGGRMRSKKIHEDYENIGASFITTSYKHLLALAKDLNLTFTVDEGAAHNVAIIDERNGVNQISGNIFQILNFNKVPFSQKLKFVLMFPMFAFEAFRFTVPDYKRLSRFDDESIRTYISRVIGKEFSRYFLEPAVHNLFSYHSESFSKAMAVGTLKHLITGRKYFNFKKGLEELPLKIAEVVETRFSVEVEKISRNPVGVTVKSKDGREYEASQVIVAVPGNKVLNIIDKPTIEETEFFASVKYSSHIKVFCETNNDLIRNFDRLVFIGESHIASTNVTHRHPEYVKFSFGIPNKPAKELIAQNKLSNEDLEKFIKESLQLEIPFKVTKPIIWDSALPMFYTGYIKKAYEFKQRNHKENQIIYVGDYLSGPFLEGAILSSVEVFEFDDF
ncbi:MAG: NAD(P)/FAD-dependent oxidoreductase [Candidatus Dojkabacteria bacterium]